MLQRKYTVMSQQLDGAREEFNWLSEQLDRMGEQLPKQIEKIKNEKKEVVAAIFKKYTELQRMPAEDEKQIWDDYLKQ